MDVVEKKVDPVEVSAKDGLARTRVLEVTTGCN
jgi:hypothetical protein